MTAKVFRRNFSAHVFKMVLGLYKYYKPCRKASCNMLIGATANIFQGMKEKTCNRETSDYSKATRNFYPKYTESLQKINRSQDIYIQL